MKLNSSQRNTQELIGVFHEQSTLQPVIRCIDKHHPNLESIMLEIPTEKSSFIENFEDGYFSIIRDYYQERGVRIINGDPRYWEVLSSSLENGLTLQEVLNLDQKSRREYEKAMTLAVANYSNNPLLELERNKDIYEMFEQEHPEVIVFGGDHAEYIKERNPEVPFSFFLRKGMLNRIISAIYYPGIIPDIIKKADKTYWV